MRAHLALLVEPDEGTRDGGVLTQVASEIEYADDGRDALAKAIGHHPALLITETRLAFIDGYVLCSILRSDQLTADAAIVIVTDDANAGGIARARSSGADSVLIKPVLPQTLLLAVERGRRCPSGLPPCLVRQAVDPTSMALSGLRRTDRSQGERAGVWSVLINGSRRRCRRLLRRHCAVRRAIRRCSLFAVTSGRRRTFV